LSTGEDNGLSGRFLSRIAIMLVRFVLSLVFWNRMSALCIGECPRFTVFAGIELLEKFDIIMIPAEKFNAHAIFQRDNGCLHGLPDNALQLAVSSVWEVNDNVKLCAGNKGMISPDEESVTGKIARNGTIVFLLADKLSLEPSKKPFVLSANFQKGS
jgi:hypothetical protein